MGIMKTLKTLIQYLMAWAVHAFTASAAFIGTLTLLKIYQGQFVQAIWLMALTVVIDALDGTFARLLRVKTVLPSVDGALLDNLVDFLNYVITPCFFLIVKPGMLPFPYAYWIIAAITTASAYQFCQLDAKTPDHFFKGFPSYWNVVVFYMFIFNTSWETNAILLIILCILIFIPIKYVYPSRLDYLTESKKLKILMHICSLSYGISAIFILLYHPNPHPLWLLVSLGYVSLYIILSFYRTLSPMIKAKVSTKNR
jgi:phosphatidylcholine synthase